jgi:hypothetical protein
VRPDGTGTFVVERGLAQPRKVAIRLTAGERDRLAKAVSSRLAETYGPSEP